MLNRVQMITNSVIIQLLNMLDLHSSKNNNWPVLQHLLLLINAVSENSNSTPSLPLLSFSYYQILAPLPDNNNAISVNFCLLGGIPAITRCAGSNYPKMVRLEAAKFIHRMTESDPVCVHMFIACGGIEVLVALLEQNYKAYKALIETTIQSIWALFQLKVWFFLLLLLLSLFRFLSFFFFFSSLSDSLKNTFLESGVAQERLLSSLHEERSPATPGHHPHECIPR